ncbi:MAG: GxxExxY protein, partial [Candidatus Marinimicrobia bacterium]|nr:GxxExxY protein [Candidatus Neomarinimicrobiota bacterium]MBT3763691.1 GxxExxY protein [Candidatus Neomarinimicrobiota bacterium]MBT4067238.1 GxxExxY protein [Candidatus Neomarinimicrobiota bacterium]MBT4808751.1 GxxExxY protein [Candidatus Neomarinimicrobiota bacterium]MBT5176314.1 GxxExxY protein [Candidatus Neomarinimicrobiota bacterium]
MTELIYKEESYKIIGACFEVYKEMGCGFLEPVYQECLEKELTLQGIPFDAQKIVALNYKGQKLDKVYKPDFF